MSESNSFATSVLKVGAVALSLALMGGYVWYRSGGTPASAETNTAAREILPGSKSAPIEIPSSTSTVDDADVPHASTLYTDVPSNTKSGSGRVVIELTPLQQAALSKALMPKSAPGSELTSEEIKALMELQAANRTTTERAVQTRRRVLLSGSKSEVLVPAAPEPVTEPPTVILKPIPAAPQPPPPASSSRSSSSGGGNAANPPPAQPRRRVLMPSSKSMVLPEDRIIYVAPPKQQAPQQGRGF